MIFYPATAPGFYCPTLPSALARPEPAPQPALPGPPATTPESSLSAPLNQQLHNRYPDNLRYLRVHLCEKLILIRHGAALFGVFLSITAQ